MRIKKDSLQLAGPEDERFVLKNFAACSLIALGRRIKQLGPVNKKQYQDEKDIALSTAGLFRTLKYMGICSEEYAMRGIKFVRRRVNDLEYRRLLYLNSSAVRVASP